MTELKCIDCGKKAEYILGGSSLCQKHYSIDTEYYKEATEKMSEYVEKVINERRWWKIF